MAALALTAIAVPGLAPVTQGAPSARTSAVNDCRTWAHYPNTRISSVRNMSCRSAARDLKSYRGSIRYRFRTPGGFTCQRVSGMSQGGQWRCVRGTRAYRFEFGD